ncbi:MAG TPA: peptidylprolyl isomerase [Planctomycetota bacterium]|nr:peptidylprolyl isomerase [Planctomycetota bacterium]
MNPELHYPRAGGRAPFFVVCAFIAVPLVSAMLPGIPLLALQVEKSPGEPRPIPPGEEKANVPGKAVAPVLPALRPAAPGDKAELPPGVLARVDGRDITLDEYASYLLASLGKSKLSEFIDRLLVEEEAKRLGISVTSEQVESLVEERLDRTLKGLYQGNRDKFLESLARRRTTLEDHRARLRQDLYYETLWSEVVLKTRQVTEADIRRHFERAYGEGGVQYVLRHILISTRVPAPGARAEGEAPAEGRTVIEGRTRAEARGKADRVLKEIQAGTDFVQAVKLYSEDAFTKQNDGRIPNYRKGFYGENFHKAVLELSPDQKVSGVVESPSGFHIIQLIEKQVTKLEDIRAEVEKAVKDQPPTVRDRHDLVERLRAKARVEGL